MRVRAYSTTMTTMEVCVFNVALSFPPFIPPFALPTPSLSVAPPCPPLHVFCSFQPESLEGGAQEEGEGGGEREGEVGEKNLTPFLSSAPQLLELRVPSTSVHADCGNHRRNRSTATVTSIKPHTVCVESPHLGVLLQNDENPRQALVPNLSEAKLSATEVEEESIQEHRKAEKGRGERKMASPLSSTVCSSQCWGALCAKHDQQRQDPPSKQAICMGNAVGERKDEKTEAAVERDANACADMAGLYSAETQNGNGCGQNKCYAVAAEETSFTALAKLFSASRQCSYCGQGWEGGIQVGMVRSVSAGQGREVESKGWGERWRQVGREEGGDARSRRKSAVDNGVLSVAVTASCRTASSGVYRRLSM